MNSYQYVFIFCDENVSLIDMPMLKKYTLVVCTANNCFKVYNDNKSFKNYLKTMQHENKFNMKSWEEISAKISI
jgi:hypothetical protein